MSETSPAVRAYVITSIRLDRDKQTRYLAAIRAKDPRDDVSKSFRRHMDEVIAAHEAETNGRVA